MSEAGSLAGQSIAGGKVRPGRISGWAIAYAIAGLAGNLVSIAVFDFYDPIRWPIVLLPRLTLFVPALAPLALVHALHLRARIGIAQALTIPVAGLGGSVALMALCAFQSSMVANWSEPYWATLFPRSLQLAAAIPGPLGLVGGAWFGLIETAVLRQAGRPRGWVLLLLPAAIVCAMLIVVTHYFASHARHLEWVAPALISLPIAGAAYGAVVEAVLRPDAVPVTRRRIEASQTAVSKRLFARWLGWHVVTALIGGLATMFAAFPVFEQFDSSIARYNSSIGIPFSVLLPLAVAPLAAYQAWALRKAVPPLLWLTLMLLVGLPPTPYLLFFALAPYHSFMGPMATWTSSVLELAVVGMFWTGLILSLPMLGLTSFWRWMLQGGVALAIGAVAVYFGLSLAIEVSWWAWPTGIVAASLVFALMTYKVVRPALVLANPAVSAPSPVGA